MNQPIRRSVLLLAPSPTRSRPGRTAGYMPELNVLCGIADFSSQSEQPVTKHLFVEVTPSRATSENP